MTRRTGGYRLRKYYLFLGQCSSAVNLVYCLTPNSWFSSKLNCLKEEILTRFTFSCVKFDRNQKETSTYEQWKCMVTNSSMLIKPATKLKQLTADMSGQGSIRKIEVSVNRTRSMQQAERVTARDTSTASPSSCPMRVWLPHWSG